VFTVRRVADLPAAVRRVRELGGTATDPFDDRNGLMSECTDDQGNGFNLVQMAPDEPRPEADGEGPGDIVYLTLSPGDEVRGRRFYSELFGWEFTPGRVARGLNVGGPRPMTGMWGGTGRQFVEPVFAVTDVEDAVRQVRDLGGTATDPHQEPYGVTSECVDNQGLSFSVVELSEPRLR
jgi:predicted enzyme related to lactoylglutathione lyase